METAGYKKMFRGPETVEKVQKLLAQGLSMNVIAERLNISVPTVWRIKRMEKSNDVQQPVSESPEGTAQP